MEEKKSEDLDQMINQDEVDEIEEDSDSQEGGDDYDDIFI